MMRTLLFFMALPAFAQLAQITDTLKNPIDGANWTGTIVVEPAIACKMTRAGVSYGLVRKTYCLGVTGSTCGASTAAGIVNIQLLPTDASTSPTGCYYTARYTPSIGTAYTETWVVGAAGPYEVNEVRTLVVPSPSARVMWSQIDWTGFADGCLKVTSGILAATTCGPATWDTITGTWGGSTSTWANI